MDLSGVKSTLLKMGRTGHEIKCLYGIIKCLCGKNGTPCLIIFVKLDLEIRER